MTDRRDYLLRSMTAVRNYEIAFKDFVSKFEATYLRWINSMPFMQWQRLEILPGTEQAVIGLICKLQLRGEVNVSFRWNDLSEIRREPKGEEIQEYLAKNEIIIKKRK